MENKCNTANCKELAIHKIIVTEHIRGKPKILSVCSDCLEHYKTKQKKGNFKSVDIIE